MFLNAVMLAGLGGAVLPLVLHLLSRARYKRVEWGAMMFLQEAESEQLHSSRLRQFLLLATRMALVALIAVALARPLASGGFAALAQGQRISAVLVIDVSPSMTYPERDRTRLELAKDAALAVLTRLRRGDQASLVLLGGGKAEAPARPTSDLQDVAARIANLQPLAGRSNVSDGVRQAYELLATAGGNSGEIYVITDRQASSWADFRTFRPPATPPARIFAIPLGSTDTHNIGIESLELLGPPAVKDLPTDIEIRIRNYGTAPRGEVPLVIIVDGKEVGRSKVYLAAGGSAVVRQRVVFRQTGSTVLTAVVEAGGLAQDDRLERAVDVVAPIAVTVVTGEEREPADVGKPDFAGEADYLRLALAPFVFTGQKGVDPAAVRVLNESQWPELSPEKDRVVVLANVGKLDPRRTRALEQFVFAGGGLLIAPGNRLDIARCNELFYRDGTGLLPAKLKAVASTEGSANRLIGIETSHPVFRFLQGRTDPVPTIAVSRYLQLDPLPASSVGLASLRSGDPLVVARSFGRGRVMLWTVPIDADWSNLPFSSLYLPLVQSSIKFLAAGGVEDRNLAPGATIEASIDKPVDNFVTIQRPDGRNVRVELTRVGGTGTVVYTDTQLTGRYVMRAKAQDARDYVVSSPVSESDLTQISPADYTTMEQAVGFKTLTADRAGIAQAVGKSRDGTEVSLWFLAVALALAGGESLAAQRWGGGGRVARQAAPATAP